MEYIDITKKMKIIKTIKTITIVPMIEIIDLFFYTKISFHKI